MRKILFLVSVLFMIACAKEQADIQSFPIQNHEPSYNAGGPHARWLVDLGGSRGLDCININNSCHPEDIVVYGFPDDYSGFKSDMENNDVQAYFSDNEWANLFPFLADSEYSNLIATLQSGDCDVTIKSSNGKTFYIFHYKSDPTAETPLYVIPIVV